MSGVKPPGQAGAVEGSGAPRLPLSTQLDSVVCFGIGTRQYALDVTAIREVVKVDALLPVPGTPAPVAGVFALRGATVALVDARILFNLDAAGDRGTALVIARGERIICGLTVDHVLGVTRVLASNFTPATPGRDAAQVAGFIADERGALLTLLDAAVLLSSLERLRF